MLNEILEKYGDEEFLKCDGFDDAIIGVDENEYRLIYSKKHIIEILLDEEMTYEDALEHYNYNILDCYMGEKTPIFCDDEFEVQ